MFVHGDNLNMKMNSRSGKYSDSLSKALLKQILPKYKEWKNENLTLKGPLSEISEQDYDTIFKRVDLFNTYKDFLDQKVYAEHFDSRSNLHSSVLEEFLFYLFRDLVFDISKNALIGKSHTFKDMFFMADNFLKMVKQPNARAETKDHDFVIGVTINADLTCKGERTRESYSLDIPAIAIECKTYLDKTMLEGSSNAAEQLQTRNPNALYIVVAERLKLSENINLKKYRVNQIYILRKQKNTDREYRLLPDYDYKPCFPDVVNHLFSSVRNHLTANWEGGISNGLEKGYLL